MRKALVVGIDYYENAGSLSGCVKDAHKVSNALERNSDGTKNFSVKTDVAASDSSMIKRRKLKDSVEELFRDPNDIALFYFSGHGYIESTGGYLITSECSDGDDGFSMSDLLLIANNSPSRNKIIILDCCHSGEVGNDTSKKDVAIISEGITILTASAANQYALEEDGSGIFTNLFVDALNGSSANLLGAITPSSIYAHIDQSLGPWDQRPIFKTNVKNFTILRKVQSAVDVEDLRKIVDFFPELGVEHQLDPDYEPESDNPDEEKMRVFSILQKYNRVNLVVPVGEKHMYFAAINRKSCKLTVLGEHYWKLVKNGQI